MTSAFWLCAVITAVSSIVSLGYSAAAVSSSGQRERTNALYAFSRSVALAVVVVVVLFMQSADWLTATAVAMVIVQAGDALIGLQIRDRLKTAGPALTAAANLTALLNFLR